MRTSYFRTILAAFVLVSTATAAIAQNGSTRLTSIEVKRLVATAGPDDHARLRDHFAAVADLYATNARRYRARAQTVTGNPNHPLAAPPSARWTRLADEAERAVASTRELSAHHDRLAAGRSSSAPPDSARFESGEGAPAPTEAQLRK